MYSTKLLLREEIALNNRKSLLSEQSLVLIKNPLYVEHVLGINVNLSEHVSFSIRKQIIEEQIIMENLLDSVKTFLKDKYNKTVETVKNVYDVILLIKDIITQPKKLETAIFLAKKNLRTYLKSLSNKILNFLNNVTIVNISNYLKPMLDKINKIILNITNLEGWKGFILVSGFSLLLKYVDTNYISRIITSPTSFLEGNTKYELESKLNLFGSLYKLIPNLTDIKQVFDWFNTIGATADLITSIFTPISDKIKFADNLMQQRNTRTQ